MTQQIGNNTLGETKHSLSLFTDKHFTEMLQLFEKRGVLYSEFQSLPMPEGFSSDEIWNVLMQIRRSQAVHYRDTCQLNGKHIASWFTETRAITELLRELSTRTQKGSPLDDALNERDGKRFIVKPLIEEATASAVCDNLTIDYETARTVISGERAAVSDAEHLVSNMHSLLINLKDAEEYAITPNFIEKMYSTLLENIDTSSFTSKVSWGDEWPEDPMPYKEALEEICALANNKLTDKTEHPIIIAQRLICKCWKMAPFQNCNYTIGSLLSRIYLKQQGYPVFIYIPSSSMTLEWKSGAYSDDVVCPYSLAGNVTETDRDWTIYWEACLKLLLMELDLLEQHIVAIKNHDDMLLKNLRADRTLNHRQIEVLSKALLVPETVYKISDHQNEYGLAYSTARSDLGTLVELGYLEMSYESKAQVFVARFDMKQIMAKRYATISSDN